MLTEPARKVGQVVVGNIEVASLCDHGGLLLVVGNARWQWREMPVDVTVGLLTAQRQHIEAFDIEQTGQRRTRAMHDPLDGEVLLSREVADRVLAMVDGGYQEVPEH